MNVEELLTKARDNLSVSTVSGSFRRISQT